MNIYIYIYIYIYIFHVHIYIHISGYSDIYISIYIYMYRLINRSRRLPPVFAWTAFRPAMKIEILKDIHIDVYIYMCICMYTYRSG